MINKLIVDCYENNYGIDLRTIHRQSSNSKAPRILTDPKIQRDLLIFSDGISTSFELVHYGHLIFLLGDHSCYPCGGIVESVYGINWVPIFVLPTGKMIKTSSNIGKTCCVNLNPIHEYLPFIRPEDFEGFVINFENSFSENDWYDRNSLRILITSYDSISVEAIYKELRVRNLLNPFELALGSIVYDFGITAVELFNCLNYSKDIAPQFTYLNYFKTRFSLADSTNTLIQTSEFRHLIDSFNLNQIEQFFEIQYLIDTIDMDNYYPDLFADVLHIKLYRQTYSMDYRNSTDVLQEKLEPLNIGKKTVGEYYRRIKSNIRNLENLVRKRHGYNEVGSFYNERAIFERLKQHFEDEDVMTQFSPIWLGRQRFDIYIKSLNVAIEYNGKQHYEPISFFGGVEGFQKTLARDELKRKKCNENGCSLIEIKYNEDIETALITIQKELGIIK
ncbi:hypothetical protein [Daejeonella lutea]|uniref:Uncharacterized protein n=1 Tax=Daejeonella lutea TaxID=572036 RepID=A0A1T5CX01_9SPHI|nr:hypothetical protein [Daejeonella lutea]SKB63992.1 hypothetical protein SAMN05661099_1981 [Daejeonella lutea]